MNRPLVPFLALLALGAALATVSPPLAQQAFAAATAESPAFIGNSGSVYPIREPADSYRDTDWLNVRYPAGEKTTIGSVIESSAASANVAGISRLIRSALMRSEGFEVVDAGRPASRKMLRARYEIRVKVTECALVSRSGGFVSGLVGSVAGSAASSLIGSNTNMLLGTVADHAIGSGIASATQSSKGMEAQLEMELSLRDREGDRELGRTRIEARSKASNLPAGMGVAEIGDIAEWNGAAMATAAQIAANKIAYRCWMWTRNTPLASR